MPEFGVIISGVTQARDVRIAHMFCRLLLILLVFELLGLPEVLCEEKGWDSVVQGMQFEWGGAGARPTPGRFPQKSANQRFVGPPGPHFITHHFM